MLIILCKLYIQNKERNNNNWISNVNNKKKSNNKNYKNKLKHLNLDLLIKNYLNQCMLMDMIKLLKENKK